MQVESIITNSPLNPAETAARRQSVCEFRGKPAMNSDAKPATIPD